MIHRPSRDRLGFALRQYVGGFISNFDFDDLEVDARDRGAVAVKERAWGLYDDFTEHRAEGPHAVQETLRSEIARWIVRRQLNFPSDDS